MTAPEQARLAPVAILCGQGEFPLRAARAAQARGREELLVGIRGVAGAGLEAFPHVWLGLGEVGAFLAALKARGIRRLAIAGAMTRPALSDMRFDFGGIRRLPGIAKLFLGGDNHLLSGALKMLEAEGLRIMGIDELAPDLLAPAGVFTARAPSEAARADIALCQEFIAAASRFDIGQGVVAHAGRIIAVEAAEGTDAMLARVADLRREGRLRLDGRAGVFVKAAKHGQDLRIDLPAIGPRTLQLAAAAQLDGIAVAVGEVLILDLAALVADAQARGLFLLGFARDKAR